MLAQKHFLTFGVLRFVIKFGIFVVILGCVRKQYFCSGFGYMDANKAILDFIGDAHACSLRVHTLLAGPLLGPSWIGQQELPTKN